MDNLRTSWSQKLSPKTSRMKQDHVLLRKDFERLPVLRKMINSTIGTRTCLGFLIVHLQKVPGRRKPIIARKVSQHFSLFK